MSEDAQGTPLTAGASASRNLPDWSAAVGAALDDLVLAGEVVAGTVQTDSGGLSRHTPRFGPEALKCGGKNLW